MIEGELNQRFSFIVNGSPAQKEARKFSEGEMRELLKNRPDLVKNIMPTDFFVGCRRPTPGNGYLEALQGEKTQVFGNQLGQITEKGFIDPDGNEVEVDVIICATGFDTTYKPKVPFSVNGVDMQEKWKGYPHAPSYLSLALADVPNYFQFAGAYCPAAHGSFFPLIEGYSSYFIKVVQKMQVEGIRSVQPKAKVVDAFLRHAVSYARSCELRISANSSTGYISEAHGVDRTLLILVQGRRPKRNTCNLSWLTAEFSSLA
jgi:cation diffusion facilitator CzcD-associated flavoprotein CzcO